MTNRSITLQPGEAITITAALAAPQPPAPAYTDLRAAMPYNPAPDEPWLKARQRTDWWQRTSTDIQRLTLHHIGSNATAAQVAAYITKSKAQGGKGLPRTQYHYHIMPDGEVLWLLDHHHGPWHDSGGDRNTALSIALHGALHTRKPPTAQVLAAARLCVDLALLYSIPTTNINGHDEWARQFTGVGTACPGWTPGGWRGEFFGVLLEVWGAHRIVVPSFALPGDDFELEDLPRE